MTTGHPRYAIPLQPDPYHVARSRLDKRTVTTAAQRLTKRDRWLLALLHEHKTLTSHQITELAFGHHSAAKRRLLLLYRLRAVDRFRPFTPTGSAPWHYVLGDAGAAILAADRGITVSELGYRRRDTLALAHSRQLAHLVGANGFFTALAAHARHHPAAELLAWWSEHRCRAAWGDTVRPDGYGRWAEHGRRVDFFLEHDTGTEQLDQLAAKIPRYLHLAADTNITTPVLFWLASPDRETHIHQLLTSPAVPVATATSTTGNPAEPVWRIAGTSGPRTRLADLPTTQRADA